MIQGLKNLHFYTGSESLRRPEVTRHLNKLKNMDKKRDLVILPKSRKPYSKYINKSDFGDFYTYGSERDLDLDNTDFMVLDVPFCLIPLDIDEVYPLSQNESPKINDIDSIEFIENFISEFIEYYDQTLISSKIIDLLGIGLYNIHPDSDNVKFIKDDERKVKAIADYQFGNGVGGEFLFEGNLKIEKSKKTGKIRHIYSNGTLIANMRASDSFFVLAKEGAKRLHSFKAFPENRVVVNKDSEPFAREGKSVFSKFVLDCDINIRSKDEVLIVNEDDELLAFGKALLNHNEIMDFSTGQAIKQEKDLEI